MMDASNRDRNAAYGNTTLADRATAVLGDRYSYGDRIHINHITFVLQDAPDAHTLVLKPLDCPRSTHIGKTGCEASVAEQLYNGLLPQTFASTKDLRERVESLERALEAAQKDLEKYETEKCRYEAQIDADKHRLKQLNEEFRDTEAQSKTDVQEVKTWYSDAQAQIQWMSEEMDKTRDEAAHAIDALKIEHTKQIAEKDSQIRQLLGNGTHDKGPRDRKPHKLVSSFAPLGNVDEGIIIGEACHGAPPDIEGNAIVNPIATISSDDDSNENDKKDVSQRVKKPFCHKEGISWVCDRFGFHFDPKYPPKDLHKKVRSKPLSRPSPIC